MGAAVQLTAQTGAVPADSRAAEIRLLENGALKRKATPGAAVLPQQAPPPVSTPVRTIQVKPDVLVGPANTGNWSLNSGFVPSNETLPGVPANNTLNNGVATRPSGNVQSVAPAANGSALPSAAVAEPRYRSPVPVPEPAASFNERFAPADEIVRAQEKAGRPPAVAPPPPLAPAAPARAIPAFTMPPADARPPNAGAVASPNDAATLPGPVAPRDPVSAAADAPVDRAPQTAAVNRLGADGWKVVQPSLERVAVGTMQVRDKKTGRMVTATKYEMRRPPDDGVVRMRKEHVAGYPGAVNVFIPANYEQDPAHAKLNLHLQGWNISEGRTAAETAEKSVFEQNNFHALISKSGTRAALVVPESSGNDDTFQDQFIYAVDKKGRASGAQNLDALMDGVAGSLGYKQVTGGALTSHSGAGWIAAHIINGSSRYAKVVDAMGGFDDGQNHGAATRLKANEAVLARGGRVFSIATLNGVSQRAMNEAVQLREHRNAPTMTVAEVEALTPGRRTEINLKWPATTDFRHFGNLNFLPKIWGDS